jgi:putative spermidine/putrescine transport system ATP-binding protein
MTFLACERLSKRFGASTVLSDLTLDVGKAEFVSLLGPSGCGKTTLLRLIAGLTRADTGSIRIDRDDVTTLPAHRRNVGVVFQNYALFPHLTVAENVAFGLENRRLGRAAVGQEVTAALAMVQMEGLRDRPVTALSGGQQQRVAMARALAVKPRLLLLDEPLSALDRKLRETMQIELRRLLRDLGITAVFVTHDQEEAMVMSDRIAVMNHGAIEQFDRPDVIYHRPATPFALEFVGQSTRLKGRITAAEGGMLAIETAVGTLRAPGNFIKGAPVLVGVRPELLAPCAEEAGEGRNRIEAAVADIVFMGSKLQLHFAAGPGEIVVAELPSGGFALPAAGSAMALAWPVADTLVYPLQ